MSSFDIPTTYIKGIPYRVDSLFLKNIETGLNYKPFDDDIIIVTYPRCGAHSMYYMVTSILNKGTAAKCSNFYGIEKISKYIKN